MADKDKKIDPFDVEALEKSLNDSATRVSTIWVSFLIFSLYLLTAAATVKHRQLLLAEPIKLPALNIDLPLWGFFFLAPTVLVIFHGYVLIQVILLARTAAAYNELLDHSLTNEVYNARARQRLANTLFAQIFAGSPREREGWLGWLLRAMAWITLAIAPILILLTFQFTFLPYHSHLVTWVHRGLIFIEMGTAFMLWPLALDPRKDFGVLRVSHLPKHARRLLSAVLRTRDAALRPARQCLFRTTTVVAVITIYFSVAAFPGEPHLNLFSGSGLFSVQCERWHSGTFDRLILPSIDVVDDDKLAKMERATDAKERSPYEGERTQDFRGRNLQCASFKSADFRRVDFGEADLTGAELDWAELDGAMLERAKLARTSMEYAKARNASFERADLTAIKAVGADFSEAWMSGANLRGADLSFASLQGAWLGGAHLVAANLSSARLQGVRASGAFFHAANFVNANLQGATLDASELHASTLTQAELGGASLRRTQMQGVVFDDVNLSSTSIEGAFLWRTSGVNCKDAQVKNPRLDAVIDVVRGDDPDTTNPIAATQSSLAAFVERVTNDLPNDLKSSTTQSLVKRLHLDESSEDQIATDNDWRTCAASALADDKFYDKLANYIVGIACATAWNAHFGADALVQTILFAELDGAPRSFTDTLTRGLLGLDQTACQTPIRLGDKAKSIVQRMHGRPKID